MRRSENLRRPASVVAALLALGLVATTIQRAYAVTTVPNAVRTNVTVASLAFSQFAVATKDAPALLQIATVTPGYRAIAYNHYSFISSAAPVTLAYLGTNSFNGGGYRGLRIGTDPARIINYLGNAGLILYSVNDGVGDPAAFRIQNNTGSAVTFSILQTY